MSEVIITVDLGTMTAYEIVKDPWKVESDRLETIKSHVTIEPRLRASDKFRDTAGRFYQGGGTSGITAGVGEQHSVELEAERRLIKQIAEDINTLILDKDCDKWFLAADRSINDQILENLAPAVKARLKKNVAANLTKLDKSKLMSYFA
ncbi:Protein required for attachment to host cells [Candidatus Methylomirabilis lanthanidiphila]|uniref:Protein required for attachment to host cells n=1 Tax=Candidatus Methylomirabilis lanthanidiphila TaxID=2211376 RepID=A0A564ZJQ9_9BACT|nr:Protein required for attachment to host cells [Candidatus Methylomirabilis lanthanidiphila]